MTDRNKLDELDRRIAAAQAAREPAPEGESKYQKANLAWQMVIELVAGLLIGLGMGWSLDWLFGTMPIFLATFCILGFIAGVRTMMRTAKRVQDKATQARQD
ncbi:ATP synthase protein I [Monaibacterium marinum]|uniref:ATP synthase protein I n=1 Tax=Pontivivens marinum TaxID=1690039 RepID=A0A2C9CTI3_9RHOB|nr:AtpZ/AtpI family protein [Monaibacterium marinum]SOH94676.1 ATP synthase protein I [Monaibacterium marinum]